MFFTTLLQRFASVPSGMNSTLRDSTSASTQRTINLSLFTQFYPPDFAATGQFMEELATQLAQQGMRVKVFTGQPGYAFEADEAPQTETRHQVHIRRCGRLKIGARQLLGRTLNSLMFCLRSLLYLLGADTLDDILLFTSEPPYLQTVGYVFSKLTGVPFACIVYDLYPDVAVGLNVLSRRHVVTRLWDWVNRRVWNRAVAIVVPCHTMRDRILAKAPELADKITVVHNWADSEWIQPLAKADNVFAKQHGLVEPFTVLYSGNMGRCHDIETIVQAAQQLQGAPVQFVFIGGGPKRPSCEEKVAELALDNCLFLPYQDKALLPQSLTACDLSLVSVDVGMEGLVAPSKFYSALASGRPVAVICEKQSYLRQLVAEANCGVAIQNGDGQALADFIRYLIDDPDMVRRLGLSGRRYVQDFFTPDGVSHQYAWLLRNAVIRHADLRDAVEQLVTQTAPPQFEVYFQPVLALGTEKVVSAEALLRWHHPDCGLLPSDVFIDAAEKTGLIIPLGWWVIEQACRQLAAWRSQFPDWSEATVSVNLSSAEFFQPDLVPRLDAILQRYQLPGRSLVLEIKDEVVMEDRSATTAIFLQLRPRQIQICIDNFGASHASLSYLHRFPVDLLKIDSRLVQRLDIDPNALSLIDTVGILAKDLNMVVVAAGIETPAHLKLLKEIGLAYGQGYVFSPAVSAEQMTARLRQGQGQPVVVSQMATPPPARSGPLVLVIDDDRFMRTLLSRAIQAEGYAVVEATTGEAGLALYQRRQPDLVIVDVNLPDMDGLTCCQRMRQSQTVPFADTVPLLVVTASDDHPLIERAFALGATDYLTKPVSWPVLTQRLKRCMTEAMRHRVYQFFSQPSSPFGGLPGLRVPADISVTGSR